MKSFGLTGGIATGKSTVAKMMKQADSKLVLFDADECVRSLYQNEKVLSEVANLFGFESLNSDGGLDRKFMREVVFSDEMMKERLQDLIHPMVRKECLAMLAHAKHSRNATLFIADIPLLFEGGFDFGQSANLVVAVSRKTQVERLKVRSGFSDATVLAILAAQLPISNKQKCADIVLWNEGPRSVLESQVKRFINQHKKFKKTHTR